MEEQINKLKQLDRIEYRLELAEITKGIVFTFLSSSMMMILVSIFTSLFFVLIAVMDKANIYLLIPFIYAGFFLGITITFLVVYIFKAIKEKNTLDNKYFKVEPKGAKK